MENKLVIYLAQIGMDIHCMVKWMIFSIEFVEIVLC